MCVNGFCQKEAEVAHRVTRCPLLALRAELNPTHQLRTLSTIAATLNQAFVPPAGPVL